jgi:copper chaperone CopZ
VAEYKLQIDGMQCEGCENIIESAAKTVDSVNEVTADREAGRVMFSAVDPAAQKHVMQAIEQRGYEVPSAGSR